MRRKYFCRALAPVGGLTSPRVQQLPEVCEAKEVTQGLDSFDHAEMNYARSNDRNVALCKSSSELEIVGSCQADGPGSHSHTQPIHPSPGRAKWTIPGWPSWTIQGRQLVVQGDRTICQTTDRLQYCFGQTSSRIHIIPRVYSKSLFRAVAKLLGYAGPKRAPGSFRAALAASSKKAMLHGV